jgi:hypothetical protein
MNLYIYSLEDLKHVATISGKDEGSIEAKANDAYDASEYGWTYRTQLVNTYLAMFC